MKWVGEDFEFHLSENTKIVIELPLPMIKENSKIYLSEMNKIVFNLSRFENNFWN